MSSGGNMTEYAKQELVTEAAILEHQALVNNAVLRRALAIAAYECKGKDTTPDAGLGLIISWVMQACEEIEKGSK